METSHCGGSYLPLVLEGRLRAELHGPHRAAAGPLAGGSCGPSFCVSESVCLLAGESRWRKVGLYGFRLMHSVIAVRAYEWARLRV